MNEYLLFPVNWFNENTPIISVKSATPTKGVQIGNGQRVQVR